MGDEQTSASRAGYSASRAGYDAALLEAQSRVVGIAKASDNKQQGYSFTSSEDLIAITGQALNHAGLTCVRLKVAVGAWSVLEIASKHGPKQMHCASVSMLFRVTHAPTGFFEDYRFEFPAVVNSAGKPFDKAVAGALTASQGYFLRDLLMVARGHDKYDIDKRPEPDQRPAPSEPAPKRKHGPVSAEALASFLRGVGFSADDYVAYRAARGLDQLDTSNEWKVGGSLEKLQHGGRGPDLAAWVEAGRPGSWTAPDGVA